MQQSSPKFVWLERWSDGLCASYPAVEALP
jgi:hypothetical protein